MISSLSHSTPSKLRQHTLLRRTPSFSLIEVVVALGIVSIGIVSILGLLPVGLAASRESAHETRAAQMAQSIFTTLRAQPFTNIFLDLDREEDHQDDVINLSQPGTRFLYADMNGEYLSVAKRENTIYTLQLSWDTDTDTLLRGFENQEDGTPRGSLVSLYITSLSNPSSTNTFVSIIGRY